MTSSPPTWPSRPLPPAGSVRQPCATGMARRVLARAPGPEMRAVLDLQNGPIPMRLYRPVAGPTPLVVYAHGGGWTIGSLDSHDRMCRRLAEGSGASVLALDHPLAPPHPQ